MKKTITAEERLNNIKASCAERDRKERNKLMANRLDMDRKEEAEKERMQNTNSILSSYMDKVRARENQQSQERSQMVQNLHDESMRRKSEDAHRTQEMTSAINRGKATARANEDKNVMDDFMSRNKRLLDKGREAVKGEQSRTYFG
ncbi:MAG: hypothetical protein NC489_41695 [Ruminococcus flavefaciens]|nr:hypothetical protein [Ruminococcus flavefaciens]